MNYLNYLILEFSVLTEKKEINALHILDLHRDFSITGINCLYTADENCSHLSEIPRYHIRQEI